MRSDAADRPDSQDLPAVVHTHCRICVALCGIAVHTEGDRVVDVKGDPDDPLSRGYTCPKGRALGAYHHDQRRLDGPLLKHDGELTATTWPGLLDDLHHRLAEILANQGADAIAIYSATGAAFDGLGRRVAEKWHRMLGSRSKYSSGTIDTPCKPLVSELMAGHPGMTPALDRENASLVVLVGINPVVSHGHLNAFPDPVVTLRYLADRRAGEQTEKALVWRRRAEERKERIEALEAAAPTPSLWERLRGSGERVPPAAAGAARLRTQTAATVKAPGCISP